MDFLWAIKKIDKKEVTELTREMVKIPSITGNEAELADYIKSRLKEIGFKVSQIEVEKNRPNIIGKLEGQKGSPILLLNGHMDTVPPGDLEKWDHDPYIGTVEKGRLYGRGACDMKGGLASMLTAAKSIADSGESLAGNIIFTAVVDEERGSIKGTKVLVDQGIKADQALIAEPSDLKVNIAHKGDLGLEIILHGKVAHAANPSKGVNAVHKMIYLIQEILNIPEKYKWNERKNHSLVGLPTLGISVIKGGIQRNMVPDYCSAVFDRRTVPRLDSIDEAKRELLTIIEESKEKDPELVVELKNILEVESCEIRESEPIVQILKNCFKKIYLREPIVTGVSYFTDAHFLVNQGGIPSAMYGPGSIDQAHAVNEYVDLEQLVDSSKVYALTIAKYLIE
jgi:acetylornithine deacetylase/succinyl-diaminopimelate desuccinylase family protein